MKELASLNNATSVTLVKNQSRSSSLWKPKYNDNEYINIDKTQIPTMAS